jgi:hypothetical protein
MTSYASLSIFGKPSLELALNKMLSWQPRSIYAALILSRSGSTAVIWQSADKCFTKAAIMFPVQHPSSSTSLGIL